MDGSHPDIRAAATRRRRDLRRSFAVVAAYGLVAGCSRSDVASRPEAAEQPHDGGTFYMAEDAPDRLDPACVDDAYEAFPVNQIFEGLVAFDMQLNTVPSIASSWIISPEGTVYTFDLRRGVLFHDGTEVTAEDVVYSLRRVFDLPQDQSGLARQYLCHILGARDYAAKKVDRIRGLEVLSPHRVRITLEHPYAPFLAVLASEFARVVPEHVVAREGDLAFARHPVGSGPFQFAEWIPDQRIVMTAFRPPSGPRAHLDSVVIALPPGNVRDYAATHFFDGSLSATVVPSGRLQEFQGRERCYVVTRQEMSLTFLALNPHRHPFEDARVRQAFAHAIDRRALLQSDRSSHIPPNGILPPGMPGYSPESKLLAYDPALAKDLLARAGYPDGRGLPSISLTLAMTSLQGRALYEGMRKQLEAVGFHLTLRELPWRAFTSELARGELQCLTVTWTADIPDPDSFLYPMCASDGSGNFVGYANPAVDSLLVQGRMTRSSMERLQIYRDAEQRTLQDAAIIPVYHPLSAAAVQQDVRGFALSAMGWASMPLEAVWLETAPRLSAQAAPPRPAPSPGAAPAVAEGRVP